MRRRLGGENLEAQGVKHVFGIPGAKIDRVFDSLEDAPSIETVVVRHEANAAFMAAAVGRLTGKAGWRWSPPGRAAPT